MMDVKEDNSAFCGDPKSRVSCIEECRGLAEDKLTLFKMDDNKNCQNVYIYVCVCTNRRITSKRVARSRLSFRNTPVNGSSEIVVWLSDSSVLAASYLSYISRQVGAQYLECMIKPTDQIE
jgi:hypothetical protein